MRAMRECPACTFKNDDDASTCDVCDEPLDAEYLRRGGALMHWRHLERGVRRVVWQQIDRRTGDESGTAQERATKRADPAP